MARRLLEGRSRLLLASLLIVVLALAFTKWKQVSKDLSKIRFAGKVTSDKAVCEKNRKVTLRQTSRGIKAGTARTNKRGNWVVVFNGNRVPAGEFKAKVAKKTVGKTVCLADKSTTFIPTADND